MESLALAVVAICGAYLFVASFVGFVIGDNYEGYAPAIVGAIVPGVAVAIYISSLAAVSFWVLGFFLGYGVGFFFRVVRK
jgi:hypothetical protein